MSHNIKTTPVYRQNISDLFVYRYVTSNDVLWCVTDSIIQKATSVDCGDITLVTAVFECPWSAGSGEFDPALSSLSCSSFVVWWDVLLVEEASILEGHKAVCLDYNNFQVAVPFQSTFI